VSYTRCVSYVIDKGVPLPAAATRDRYGWAKLDVGDSIMFATEVAERAWSAARAFEARNKAGVKFRQQRFEDGSRRIWRIG